jgi:hypothetical protein
LFASGEVHGPELYVVSAELKASGGVERDWRRGFEEISSLNAVPTFNVFKTVSIAVAVTVHLQTPSPARARVGELRPVGVVAARSVHRVGVG